MFTPRMLTVPQPWAWAIVHGHQPLYTHFEEVYYRGPLLIHSKRTGSDVEGYQWLRELGFDVPPMEDLLRGYIVGQVSLLDCLPANETRLPPDLARWASEEGCHLLMRAPLLADSPEPVSGHATLTHAPRHWKRAFQAPQWGFSTGLAVT